MTGWWTLTIVLGGYGLKSSNKLCMVAYFHSETILWMRHTFSSYRDGSLFCRNRIRSGRVWKELCCRHLCRFFGLIVKWTDCTPKAAWGTNRFGLRWFDISSARQDRAVQMLIRLRKRTGDLYLQIKTKQSTASVKLIPIRKDITCLSTNLTCLDEAESLFRVLWLIWWLDPHGSCWFGRWSWSEKLCDSFLKGGANCFCAETDVGLSFAEMPRSRGMVCLGICACTEILLKPAECCLLVLTLCPSLWALLSKAFRLFSSIFRCCSAVSWFDMLTTN